jgi:RHS repeat-associated protein
LFDAWGSLIKLKRNGVLSALPTASNSLFLDRGYTGHEHLWEYNLINMNGRLYDPTLHRFLQPDNDIQDPSNTQNFNRYGYCLNNPLKYTDPSGENWWNDFIAGAAIVVGTALAVFSGGTLAGIGYALIASGVDHFIRTGIEYGNNGGDWSAASTTAGNFFSYSVDISGSSGNDGNGAHSGGSNTNNPIEQHNYVVDWDSVATRGLGGLQMVGGILETVAGGATAEFGVGVVIAINGADNASAGFMQLITGVTQNTLLHKAVKTTYIAAGGSESNAETAGTVADVGATVFGGYGAYKIYKAQQLSTVVVEGGSKFFNEASYSQKVLNQMNKADDLFHGFPKSVDAFAAKYGQWSTKLGADGKPYQWLKLSGSYGGKTGIFEYTKDANGLINHRFFNIN